MTSSFPTFTRDEWRRRVAEELGPKASLERALASHTLEGLSVSALYTAEDADDAAGAASRRAGGWAIAQSAAATAPAAANRELLEDLENGGTGLSVGLDRATRGSEDFAGDGGSDGVRVQWIHDLDALLDGVHLEAVPIAFGTNANGLGLAATFAALCRERDVDPANVEVHVGMDPIATLAADGALPGDVDDARRELAMLAEYSRLQLDRARSLAVDASVWHRAGGHAVHELGYALSSFVEMLRWLEDAGLPPGAAHPEFVWRFDVGRDVFTQMAKLRAARLLHAKVLGSAGIESATPLAVHATTSPRCLARRDPWTNMLRATLETFAATAGGADLVTTQPYDALREGGASALGRRHARNVQLVLALESHLDRVGDPGRGAYALEARTDALARGAWELMRDVERGGGIVAAIESGRVADDLGAARDGLRREIATRRRPIVGVSEFPADEPPGRTASGNPSESGAGRAARLASRGTVAIGAIDGFDHAVEAAAAGATLDEIGGGLVRGARVQVAPLPSFREASVFEDLVDAADRMDRRPRVYLACLGSLAAHGARATFAANLFRAGGLEVVQGDPEPAADDVGAGFEASGAQFACVCGTDDAYAESAQAAIRGLHASGARAVLIARREMDGDDDLRAAGLNGHVHLGCDAAAVLRELLEIEGAVLAPEEVVL